MILVGLTIHDDPARWRAVGFAPAADGTFAVGPVTLRVVPGEPRGLAAWTVDGLGEVDGLPASSASEADAPGEHPNGAVAVDHVVLVTDDVDRTVAAFVAAGLEPRRERVAGSVRQAFFVLGTALAEVAGPAAGHAVPEAFAQTVVPCRSTLWGITVDVADLDACAELLGEALGDVADAVQPGRRIATVRRDAGLAVPLAFMSARRA